MIDAHQIRAAALEHRAVLGGPTVVHLNPSDAAALTPEDRQIILAGGGISIVGDPDVEPGGYSIGKGVHR